MATAAASHTTRARRSAVARRAAAGASAACASPTATGASTAPLSARSKASGAPGGTSRRTRRPACSTIARRAATVGGRCHCPAAGCAGEQDHSHEASGEG